MSTNINWETLKEFFLPYLENLKNFQFSYLNPLFWLSLFLLFLLCLKFWNTRKSFSFSLITGMLFLATTKVENFATASFAKTGEPFDPAIIRMVSAFFILLVLVYYIFIRGD